MSTIAFAAKAGGTWYDIRFRYDQDLVDLIKTVIPAVYRKYDPATHTWSAGVTWAMEFASQATVVGHTCMGITVPPPRGWTKPPGGSRPPPSGASSSFWGPGSSRSTPPMPPTPPALTENWARELFRRTPPELREKLYKNLAKVLHEDLGGDGRLMQELNDARRSYDREETA